MGIFLYKEQLHLLSERERIMKRGIGSAGLDERAQTSGLRIPNAAFYRLNYI